MSRMPIAKSLTLAVLLVTASLVVLVTARSALRLSQYPVRQAADLRRQLATVDDLAVEKRVQLETALLQYETDNRIKIWTTIVQAAGGAALLVGLLFTARNLRATQDKLDIDRQGQLTNRFIQATGQLGAELKEGQPNVEVRLGGIYALNRISNDWPKDYWPIVDVLTAYVRHNARWSSSSVAGQESTPTTDIQAILTVLGRNDPPGGFNDRHKLDLRNTDLRGAEFWDARLEWTDLWGAHLEGAKFWGADLRNAKLEHAHLVGANLRGANLEGASLEGADVTGAVFDRDTVWPAGFDARARGAVFIE
jgi:Pentapeptide repeats (8 copies)